MESLKAKIFFLLVIFDRLDNLRKITIDHAARIRRTAFTLFYLYVLNDRPIFVL